MSGIHCETCRCAAKTGERAPRGSHLRDCCRNVGYERWPGEPCPQHATGHIECRCETTLRRIDGTEVTRNSPHPWSKVFGCPQERKGPNLGHRGDELWLVDGKKTPHGRDEYYAELRRQREAVGAPQGSSTRTAWTP